MRDRLQSFRSVIAFRMIPLYAGDSGRVELAFGLLLSGDYFEALGLQPIAGRSGGEHAYG